jgi:GAF domain-containing protein
VDSMGDERDDVGLAPVAHTRDAFDWFSSAGNDEVEQSMVDMSARVRAIAPECVALSLTVADGGLTFTLVADRPGVGLLDAMQYLDGGPCVSSVANHRIETTSDLPTDEGQWQLFAQAEAITGISSTLSLPVMRGGQTVGGVNLYGSTNDCFDGRHEPLAEACGAWAEGAITNADLGFTSRVRAAATVERLHDLGRVDVATGIIADHQEIELALSRSRIRQAAARAGVSEAEFANFILDAHAHDLP